MDQNDAESTTPTRIPHWRQVWHPEGITPEVRQWPYRGSGTRDDPYAVEWINNDPRDPMQWNSITRWSVVMVVASAALMVSIDSSAYSGSAAAIMQDFECSEEVFILGLSMFVLGFAVGPIIWGPLSETFGRRRVFILTYLTFTIFNVGVAVAQSLPALLVLRFFCGAFGSNSLISAGAVVADQFPPRQRGLALAYYSVTPFLGPVFGPIIGGFVTETIGWRWVEGIIAIATATILTFYIVTVPETYAPVLLRLRAQELSTETGDVYKSQLEIRLGPKKLSAVLRIALSRPWLLLLREPIVTVLSVYQAIIYATLYLCFAAFPIVYQEKRGWSPGCGGLAFLGVMVGMLLTLPYNIWTNKRYALLSDQHRGFAPPEARLPLCMAGAIAAPIGLFWFAWTNSPSLNYMISIAAGAPFGFSIVVVFQGINNYLMDSYTIFAASVLAGAAVLRSIFACVFPLVTRQMFEKLGIHWGASIPAFLALLFAPFPFLLYKYGPAIRARCRYSAEAAEYMKQLKSERAQQRSIASIRALQDPADQAEAVEGSTIDKQIVADEEILKEVIP